MKKLFLILFTSLFFLPKANAQSKIFGTISTADNEPIEFANVLLMNSQDSSLVKGTITDSLGRYSYDHVSPGSYFIKASMVGYGAGESAVFAYDGTNSLEVPLVNISDGVDLNEVVVTTTKPFIELQADKVVVNIANSTVASGNNALEILQMSPGVTVDKDNNISLKGKQGVLVTIDGKNQYMSNEDIARLLESMPASNIESIEIIQNPSAKYDAEGNAGIINIKLKRNENLGYNGNLTLAGRQGRYNNYNGSLQLNYRSSKMNIYGNLSHNNWNGFNDVYLRRDIPYDGNSTLFVQNSLFRWGGHGNNLRAGADFFIGEKTTLGVLSKVNFGISQNNNDNVTNISGGNAPDFDRLEVGSETENNWTQQSYNANLKREFGDNGSAIVLDMDYSTYGSPEFLLYNNRYYDTEGGTTIDPSSLRNNTDISVDIFAAKLDYNNRFGKLDFESGLKFSSVTTENETVFEDLIDENWTLNTNRTNQFSYQEDIYAAYVNGATQIGKVNLKFGLRMEHTKSIGNSVTLEQIVEREYTNLFPSVSLNHQIGEKHSLSYTYSRRLNRPNYKNLNPFINYLDDFTFEKGNPFLRPQYADAFGINYGFGKSLFISANYSKTTEVMTQVIEQFSDQNTTYQTYQNLDDFESASLNVTAPLTIADFLTTRISATAFFNKFNSEIPSGTLNNAKASYNFYIGNDISLSQTVKAEVIFNYTSAVVWSLFQIEPKYNLDLGISTKIFNGNGSLKIGMNDVFRTLIHRVDVQQDDIDLKVRQYRDSRRVNLSFSYRFGNQKVKPARSRSTATEEEAGRIGSE